MPDGVTSLCGVGHSFGGAALLLAEAAGTARFDKVLTCERRKEVAMHCVLTSAQHAN